jgi:hypothetical protein
MSENKNFRDRLIQSGLGPIGGSLYARLTEEQKQNLKRFAGGIGTTALTESVSLGRMVVDNTIPKPLKPVTEKVYEKQEDVLQALYNTIYGSENVELKKRGERKVAGIKRPTNETTAIAGDVVEIGVGLVGAGKFAKASKLFKPKQKEKALSAKNIFIGEAGTQIGVNPYEDELLFAPLIGSMISEEEGMLGDLKEYLEGDRQKKSELQNRINLLADGLIIAGGMGVVGFVGKGTASGAKALDEKLAFRENFKKLLDNISEKGSEAIENFLTRIENITKTNEAVKSTALKNRQKAISEGKVSNLGDIESLKPGAFSKWITSTNLQFSENKILRSFNDYRRRLFSTKGGRTKEQHEKFLKTENVKEKWTDTITNVATNLENSIDNIVNNLGKNKEDVINQINYVLFTDFRTPTLVTRKGISVGKTQKGTFEKELNKLPENLRKPVQEARELQDRLSKLMLESDLLTETQKKIYRDNLGFYVRRSYKLFEDPNYVPTPKAIKEATNYIQTQLIKQDPSLAENPDSLLLQVNAEINSILGKGTDANSFQSNLNKFDRLRTQILKGKKEIPSEIKNLLGEVEDPVQKLINSTTKLSRLVEDNKFYQEAYDDGLGIYFREDAEGIFSEVIPTGYGKLSGLHTTPEMIRYFSDYKRMGQTLLENNSLWRGTVVLKGLSQAAKTVWSHATHVKNIMGGVQMSLANGVNVFSVKETLKIKNILKARTSNNEELQKLHEELSGRGLLNKGVVARELIGLARDVDSIPKGKVMGTIDWMMSGEAIPYFSLKDLKFKSTSIKKIASLAQKGYVAEDDFFKINMYFREQEYLKKFNNALPENSPLKLSDDELKDKAARMVRDVLPNYDLVPELLQDLRRTPFFGRFFSFMAESVRITANSVYRGVKEINSGNQIIKQGDVEAGKIVRNRGSLRLGSFMAVAGAGANVAEKGYQAITGFGKEDLEAAKDFQADYMQNSKVIVTLSDDGTPMIANLSSWDAYDFPKKPFQVIVNKALSGPVLDDENLVKDILTTTLTETVSPFLGESIIQEQLSNFIIRNGRDIDGKLISNAFDRTQKYDDSGTLVENWLNPNNLQIVLSNLLESVTPATITRGIDYVDTIGKEKTEWDQTIHPEQEFLKFLTGWGSQPLNDEYKENIYKFKAAKLNRAKSKRIQRINNAITTPFNVDDFTNRYLEENQKYYKEVAKFQKMTKSAEHFNLDVLPLMKEAGISRADMSAFVGTPSFVPTGISEATQIKMLDSSDKVSDYLDAMLTIQEIDRNLSNLPILADPENYKEQKQTLEELRDKLRENYAEGGEVIGPKVPFTKEDPADRVDPFTGLPYSEQMGRLGFAEGGLTPEQQYLQFYNLAVKAGNAFPDIVAAQASLESGHGKSELTRKYNNPLGLKVNRPSEIAAGQQSVLMSTKEFVDGKEGTYKEPFRKFNTLADSFLGYKEKVSAKRYDSIRAAKTKEEYANALQQSGYATDPEYAKKLINIANRYKYLLED